LRERGNSGSSSILPRLAGDKLRHVVVRGFWFSTVGFDSPSLFVYRPEGVAKQVFRVIFSFDLCESVPVLAETGFGCVCPIAATEKLEGVMRNHHNWDAGGRMCYVRLGMVRLAPQALTFHLATVNDYVNYRNIA